MLDLNPEDLTIIRKILATYVPGMIVWAYGSRVNGKAHEGSDLDLVIINPQNSTLPQENIALLRSELSESNLPILVDVMDWALIPDPFRQEIKKNHEVIQ